MTYVVAPAPSRRDTKKPSPVIVALAAAACVAAGGGGYLLLSGSSSTTSTPAPVVHHVPHPAATAKQTAAQQAAAAQALLTRALAASQARGSEVTTETDVEDGVTETASAWSGMTTAAATVQIAGKGQVTLRVVGPVAYLNGDAPVMQFLTGDSAAADLLGGKWLEVAKGDKAYADLMDQATFSDPLKQEWFRGTVTQLPATTLNGRRVIPLRGAPYDKSAGPSAIATLYVAADGDPLPVQFEMTSATAHVVDVYGGWGTQQLVIAPPVAIDEAWLENAAAAATANPTDSSTSRIT